MSGGFKAWLRHQQHRRDPVGDLARDAHHDHEWPRGSARLRTLHDHLDEMNACAAAHDALDRAWLEWDRERTS
jgi:uncharacterized protein YozE (UPF0346 family)